MASEDGEMYLDVVKGEMRPRKGARKIKRGPYSAEEAAMINDFDLLLSAERHMHGVLAQTTCRDVSLLLIRIRTLMERYSYANCPDVDGIDPHVIANELDIAVPEHAAVDDLDVYRDLRLWFGHARPFVREQQQFCLSGTPE